jgi:hypothetical protein
MDCSAQGIEKTTLFGRIQQGIRFRQRPSLRQRRGIQLLVKRLFKRFRLVLEVKAFRHRPSLSMIVSVDQACFVVAICTSSSFLPVPGT